MNSKFDPGADMPAGLRMALTQDLRALNKLTSLPFAQQMDFIQGAHHIDSKEEMQAYVDSLLRGF